MIESSLKSILSMFSLIRKFINKSPLRSRIDAYVQAQFMKLFEQEFDKYYNNRSWEEASLEGREKKTVKIDGDICINCHLDSFLSELIYKKVFENDEIQFLKKYLRQGDYFVDVGANIGLFSLVAAKYVTPTGKIFSFEPTNSTFERLLTNINMNGFDQVNSLNLALSNENTTSKIAISTDGFDAWNTLGRPTRGENYEYQEIKTVLLDDFIAENYIDPKQISLIKIDVEGWEIPVIEGSKNLLAHSDAPPLLIEFTEENARAAGFTCQDLFKMVAHFGYNWFSYDAHSNAILPEEMRDYYPYTNLIATKHPEQLLKRLNDEL